MDQIAALLAEEEAGGRDVFEGMSDAQKFQMFQKAKAMMTVQFPEERLGLQVIINFFLFTGQLIIQ